MKVGVADAALGCSPSGEGDELQEEMASCGLPSMRRSPSSLSKVGCLCCKLHLSMRILGRTSECRPDVDSCGEEDNYENNGSYHLNRGPVKLAQLNLQR